MTQIKKFSEFNIARPNETNFVGDKIPVVKVLNRTIVIWDYKIEKSNFEKGDGKRLVLQIEFKGNKHIIFSSALGLKEMIQKVPKEQLPIEATIECVDERYFFS